MLQGRDLLVLARRTAGLSQAALAQRPGRLRSTIARWELGEMHPSCDAVMQAVQACGLAATVQLAHADESHLHHVGEQLRRPPIERLERLADADRARVVRELARVGGEAIGYRRHRRALHGWPLRLPPGEPVELYAPRRRARAWSRVSSGPSRSGRHTLLLTTPSPSSTQGAAQGQGAFRWSWILPPPSVPCAA